MALNAFPKRQVLVLNNYMDVFYDIWYHTYG